MWHVAETTWGDGQRLSVSSQEDDSDQPPYKKRKSYSNYVKGMATLTDNLALFNGKNCIVLSQWF